MKSILIRLIILVVILSVPTYFIYKDYSISKSTTTDVSKATSTAGAVTPVVAPVKGEAVAPSIETPGVSIVSLENVGSKSVSTQTAPNLDKPWMLPADYSAEVKRIMNFKIDERTRDLKNNPDQFDKWLDLAYLRKTIGDYNEAKVILEYTASGWPESFLPRHNLGDLYANYLKDNAMAEKNMLKVIELDPAYIADYISLYELYKKMYGEANERTIAILLRGLKGNPQSIDLLMTTALHYKNVNDKDNAKKYYNLAIAEAAKLKDDLLIKDIQSEINNL